MFICLHRLDNSPVTPDDMAPFRRRLADVSDGIITVHVDGSFAALCSDTGFGPAIVRLEGCLAVGSVRLDNRDEIASWCSTDESQSDIAVMLAAIEQRGEGGVPQILGDFAAVFWNPFKVQVRAARDAFGVRTLYLRQHAGIVAFSSEASLLGQEGAYDHDYIADFLANGDPRSTRTIWRDVRAVPQGATVTVRGASVVTHTYWSPESFSPSNGHGSDDDVNRFRVLFTQAVQSRLSDSGRTWAELSGGLDSSSIVSLAETLRRNGRAQYGVAGTLTLVDEMGEGDERRYSDLVVNEFGLRNEQVFNYWAWRDDGIEPPRTDQPTVIYPYFARDEHVCTTLRRAGARELLSGLGSDHYLYGNKLFLADAAARGNVIHAVTGLATWAVAERRSFWRSLGRDLVYPLLPTALRRHYALAENRVPAWLTTSFVTSASVRDRLPLERELHTGPRCRFAYEIAEGLLDIGRWIPRGPYENGLEMRFPFLFRPLVEFGLSLPPSMRADPMEPKPVLREAMRGTLPEPIRRRQGKGGIDSRFVWSLWHERERLFGMLREPILADLGCVEPGLIRAAIESTWRGARPTLVQLLRALALETWLYVRSGQWVVGRAEQLPRALVAR